MELKERKKETKRQRQDPGRKGIRRETGAYTMRPEEIFRDHMSLKETEKTRETE